MKKILKTLKGLKIFLRPIRPADLSLLRAWHNDKRLARLTARDRRRSVSAREQKRWLSRLKRRKDTLQWVVCVRPSGKRIGKAGLWRVDVRRKKAELGLFVARVGARRRGCGTEIVRLLAGHAFGSMALRRLEARVSPGNKASMKFFERCGWIKKKKRSGKSTDAVYRFEPPSARAARRRSRP